MKKFNLKNAFTAAGIAVFAGVLTIGVNAAMGVSSPTEIPNNSTLVSPTFNGVDVQGEIINSNSEDGGAVVIDDLLEVKDDISVDGNIVLSGSAPTLTLTDTDASTSRPSIKFQGNNKHVFQADDVSNEQFEFYSRDTANRTFDALLRVYGKKVGTDTINRYIELTHDGSNGSISTNGGDIVINDSASVTGNLGVTGYIHGAGTSPVSIGSNLSLDGDLNMWKKTINSDQTMTASHKFSVDNDTGNILTNGDITAKGLNISAEYDDSNSNTTSSETALEFEEGIGDFILRNIIRFSNGRTTTLPFFSVSNDTGNVNIYGDLTVKKRTFQNGNVTVNDVFKVNNVTGKITATGGFGTITDRVTTFPTTAFRFLNAGNCNAGETILSCGFDTDGDGYITSIKTSNNSCYLDFTNISRPTNGLYPRAQIFTRCLDPAR